MMNTIKLFIPINVIHFLNEVNASLNFTNSFKQLYEKLEVLFDEIKYTSQYLELSINEIRGIPYVKTFYENEIYRMEIFINDDNWNLEEQIYNKYRELLKENYNINFIMHINHLFGDEPEELVKYMLG